MPLGYCLDVKSHTAVCGKKVLDVLWVKYQDVLSAVCVGVLSEIQPMYESLLCQNRTGSVHGSVSVQSDKVAANAFVDFSSKTTFETVICLQKCCVPEE